MQIVRLGIAALALTAAVIGCRGKSTEVADRPCADVKEEVVEEMLKQYPFNRLDDDVRDRIEDSWGKSGQICVVSNQSPQMCNYGTMREPKERACCHMDAPNLRLTNIPDRIEIRDQEGKPPLVDLKLTATGSNRAENVRCVVPTCEDDTYSADAIVRVEGTIRLEDESVAVGVDLQMKDRLQQVCDLK